MQNQKSYNNYPVKEFLNKSLLINCITENNYYCMFQSPFRKENEPSFKVDTEKNLWFDFGESCGGTLIDFIIKYYKCTYLQAIEKIKSLKPNENDFFSFHSQNSNHKTTSNIEIKHIQPLQNKALIQYLSLRKIPFHLAKNYISEVYYKTTNKQYFAIAFKNNSDGYELRNGFKTPKFPDGFKGSIHPKDITTIGIKNSHAINIFEGFMDYLTALQFFKTDKPNQTTIILNSTTNINKTLSIIKQYKTVNLFLDNDSTGTKAVETYQTAHPNIKNRALEFYPKHKDFNEFLTKGI